MYYYQHNISSGDQKVVNAKQNMKKISFTPSITVHPIHNLSRNQSDKSALYYSRDDLCSFYKDAKSMCRLSSTNLLLDESLLRGAHDVKQDCLLGLEANPEFRGLEQYVCPIRALNKLLAHKFILKYQRKMNSGACKTKEEKLIALAGACAKVSQWAKSVAMETARLDSLRAHSKDYLIHVGGPVAIIPFPPLKRRELITHDEQDCHLPKRRRLI